MRIFQERRGMYLITEFSPCLELLSLTAAIVQCLSWPPAQYTHGRNSGYNSKNTMEEAQNLCPKSSHLTHRDIFLWSDIKTPCT
jgi:hypothetical protein